MLQKKVLEEFISLGLSQRKMAAELGCSQGNIKHYLKKYQLKTALKRIPVLPTGEKLCPICNEFKTLRHFYSKHKKGSANIGKAQYCKKCSNEYHGNRIAEVKIKMVRHKGGECDHCKLKLENAHYAVFEFHHVDPSLKSKDVVFSRIKFRAWAAIEKELAKCILLCANCHRIEHVKMRRRPPIRAGA